MRKESRWRFWNWVRIADGGDVYLDRLEILVTPWFGIKLHRIHRPDRQRDLHDHPWRFLSIILFGFYVEETYNPETNRGEEWRICRWFNWKGLNDFHSIRWVSRNPVWTLVIHGAKRQVWGFQTKEGWKAWHDYERLDQP